MADPRFPGTTPVHTPGMSGVTASCPRNRREQEQAAHIDRCYLVAGVFSELGFEEQAEAWLVDQVGR